MNKLSFDQIYELNEPYASSIPAKIARLMLRDPEAGCGALEGLTGGYYSAEELLDEYRRVLADCDDEFEAIRNFVDYALELDL